MKKLIDSKSRLFISIVILFAIISITNSCKKTSDMPGPNEVWIEGSAFNPPTISVAAGTTITWTNKDAIPHRPASDAVLFDSGIMNTNGVYSFVFTTAGPHPYRCLIHPTMTGTVIVN